MTERQQKAWDEIGRDYVIDLPRWGSSTSVDPKARLELSSVFGRSAPTVLEIGSGRGESLVHAAKSYPDYDFLALEVYIPGVAQTLVSMRHEGVDNIRMAVINAPEALAHTFAPESFEEVRMWFPDPWHKNRHHKRRLITDEFAPLVHRVLKSGGIWRVATDWQDYADQVRDVMGASELFVFSGDWDLRFADRPITRFEARGIAAGRDIRDLSARKA